MLQILLRSLAWFDFCFCLFFAVSTLVMRYTCSAVGSGVSSLVLRWRAVQASMCAVKQVHDRMMSWVELVLRGGGWLAKECA